MASSAQTTPPQFGRFHSSENEFAGIVATVRAYLFDSMSSIATVPVTDTVFDCDDCENTIVHVLKETAGVDDVSIESSDQALAIEFDSEMTDREELHHVVETWGYAPD